MSEILELDNTRQELLRLRAELTRQRDAAPTPGIAHALRLADTYLFLALGYTGHAERLFPEEGSADGDLSPLPNLL
jgi:hypothetical protein